MWNLFVFLFVFIVRIRQCRTLEFVDGVYNDITISIENDVPTEGCQSIASNLERAMHDTSESISRALGGRARWGRIVVLVPHSWPDSCVPGGAPEPARGGETSPTVFRIGQSHPVYRDSPWTQQSKPCGYQGDFIYFSYRLLLEYNNIGRKLAREWAKFRYGVFDEVGYDSDPVYPSCYRSDFSEKPQINGCSDKPISENGMCKRGVPLNVSRLVSPDAQSSLMFTDAQNVDYFCDITSHDRFAPTKQNNLCNRQSVMQVINQHSDFINKTKTSVTRETMNNTPHVVYKRETLTRYVLVIEDTKDMLMRESWSYLRMAIRKWVVVQLEKNVEVGLVSANESKATILQNVTPLYSTAIRDLLASNVPYIPGDSRGACLSCGINMAYKLLQDRTQINGPANSVIILIAPGTQEHVPDLIDLIPKLRKAHIRVATVTYPAQVRPKPLDWIAKATNGIAYTVLENKYNIATSFISTYFKLTNVMWAIQEKFYQGDRADLPVEIHRKEITDNGQNTVVGSFVLDDWLGEPARFTVLVHNTENPLIRSITLVSPSHRTYSTRSDALLSLKLLTVPANINETGTWTYTIERFSGSPQPHYVQVMATPRSSRSPVVNAKFYTTHFKDALILYTAVKRGDYPVLGAKVEVTVTKQVTNGTIHKERFELMDSGGGEPDLMKGDGIYSRYFSGHIGGPGPYTFEVTIHDNFNNAYTWQHGNFINGGLVTSVPCCGSFMPAPTVEPLSPFQRVLPPETVYIHQGDLNGNPLGRVGDLRAVILASDLKSRLTWTSPDMGGKPVARYELKYAKSIGDILDNFDSVASSWIYEQPFPLAPGSETTFTLDFTRNPSLLDQTLYFAIRGFIDTSQFAKSGLISNWVRVNVPSPPPPPPVPTQTSTLLPVWTSHQEEDIIPSIQEQLELNLELILPLAVGIFLLIIAIITYCYFCFKKRSKKETKPAKHPEKPLNVSIVPTENGNNVSSPTVPNSPSYNGGVNNSISNVTQYEMRIEDDQKRYSYSNYDGLSPQNGNAIISGYGNGTLTVINEYEQNDAALREKTLSPYQSWSASQLLQEHERRTSPYGQAEDYLAQYYSPPVPPLPNYQQDIYGTAQHQLPPPNQFMNYPPPAMYNPSLQGSMTSVNGSTDRRLRNVTMV